MPLLTLGQFHGHLAVFVYFFDGRDNRHTFLLGLYTWGWSIVRLLYDLFKRLKLVRIPVDIGDCHPGFLATSEIVGAEGDVLSRRASPCPKRGLSAVSGFAGHYWPSSLSMAASLGVEMVGNKQGASRRVNQSRYVTRYVVTLSNTRVVVYGGVDLAIADLSSESVPLRILYFFVIPALPTAT